MNAIKIVGTLSLALIDGGCHSPCRQPVMGYGEGDVSMEKKEIRFLLFCLCNRVYLQKLHLLE